MITKLRKCLESDRGQSTVEFALLLPIFIVILFGIMEFGRLWETSNILTSAAREAVRVAAVTSPDVYQAMQAAQRVLYAGNIHGAEISVNGPDIYGEVRVTVNLQYIPLTGSIIPGIGSLSLSRSTTMRWEG